MQGSKAVGHCKPVAAIFKPFASQPSGERSGSCTAVPARYLRRRLIRAEPSRVLDDTRELLSSCSSLAPFARSTTARPDPSHRSSRCLLCFIQEPSLDFLSSVPPSLWTHRTPFVRPRAPHTVVPSCREVCRTPLPFALGSVACMTSFAVSRCLVFETTDTTLPGGENKHTRGRRGR